MKESNTGAERSCIPEYRVPELRGFDHDLRQEDGFLSPPEPEIDVDARVPSTGQDRELQREEDALLRIMSALLPAGGRALVFEPTRPDIRFAIVQRGARYIDGGRLLDGRPDPVVLKYLQECSVDLMVFEADDEIPTGFPTPILVDTRAFPCGSVANRSQHYKLRALSPRDGYSGHVGVWLESPEGHSHHPGGDEEKRHVFSAACSEEGFVARAGDRLARFQQSISFLQAHALEAGFESIQRAGFLWLGVPGFTSEEIQSAFRLAGVGVFACEHHPYRHRVRLTPPDLREAETLSLIFSRAYKILTA